jgi:hypothetical protein
VKIFFDTEFIEDGKTIDLVSIGLIREDGKTYYAESYEVDLDKGDDWFMLNVYPLLERPAGKRENWKSRKQIAHEIKDFVGSEPEFWAYYADYDWIALCQLYGRMIDLPRGWPMFCRDLKQMAGNVKLPDQTTPEHNALNDAIWVKESYEWLKSFY